MENSETKQGQAWRPVGNQACATSAMNTASGVMVRTRAPSTTGLVFIPGEHWDAEAGEFIALGGLATRMNEALVQLENLEAEVLEVLETDRLEDEGIAPGWLLTVAARLRKALP